MRLNSALMSYDHPWRGEGTGGAKVVLLLCGGYGVRVGGDRCCRSGFGGSVYGSSHGLKVAKAVETASTGNSRKLPGF